MTKAKNFRHFDENKFLKKLALFRKLGVFTTLRTNLNVYAIQKELKTQFF